MKKSLLLYLFIIALLMNVFTYMYFSKKSASDRAFKQTTEKKLNDSVIVLYNKYTDANYFSLEYNQNAQNYFAMNAETPIDYTKLIPLVNEKLMAFNDDPKGNPYTGQQQMGTKKFIINKAKVLNHRWIIADFSDGEYWGEVLLKYFPNSDGTVSFGVIQSLLYQK
jgi:hypothetical protein